jgi:TPP-dependent pyruvate/acetoin dehydrogenase alpha subunit
MSCQKLNVLDLQGFEEEIAELFGQGRIKAPVHLRKGREQHLIDIFEQYKIGNEDYIYAYWDSHELALLKGVPREDVKQAILEGRSIALCFPKYKLLCSGIVGSLAGAAVGTAWALKKENKSGRVFHFCGEMSSETGIFYEAVKYATHFDLPVTFVISDNGLSVMTPTRDIWGSDVPWFKDTRYAEKIIYFQYKNEYPHSGLGWKIKF